MKNEWYYTVGGEQAGPVAWDDLKALLAQKKIGASDLVWNEEMPEWAEAKTVPGLLPKGPPPLPKSNALAVAKPATVTGEVVLDGLGGGMMPGQLNKMEVKLSGKSLGSGTLVGGVRLPFEATVGAHTVEIAMSGGITSLLGGFGKKLEGAASGRTYPVTFDQPGHYLLTLTPSNVRGLPPSGVEVGLTAESPQQLALAPVAEEEPVEGAVQKGFAAIGRGWSNMRESSRRSQLHGVWEAVDGEGEWFMFTRDGGMLRGDGFGAKFRWPDDDHVEVYEAGCAATARFQVLSLGKHELLLKAGTHTGHFKRGVSITEGEEQRLREEARRRLAETRQQVLGAVGTVAAVLAVGGLAVLCGAAVAGGAAAGGAGGENSGPAYEQEPCGYCTQRGWTGPGPNNRQTCHICGGKGYMMRKR